MTAYVVFLAFFLAAHYANRHGLEAVFLKVWIPIFLYIPFVFTAKIPMVPIRTFAQAAIVPIIFFLILQRGRVIRWGYLETLLVTYVVLRVGADYTSRGYKDAQNYAFYMLSCMVGPYLMGRYIINSRAMDIKTAKLFVLILLSFFPMFLYEAKFWVSPIFKAMSPLFPGATSGLSIRYGLARTAGTFEHPILACIMVLAAYRLHRWLSWSGAWNEPQDGWLLRIQRWFKPLPFSFQVQVSIVLILMALMTISRGPWIGGVAAAVLVAAGNMKNRKRALIMVFVLLLSGGIGGKLALDAYITPAEGQLMAAEAQTMLYRKVMVERYTEVFIEKMWTGWGLTTVPEIKGMESIDNAFFLMALQHGLLAPIVFVVMFLYAIVSQLILGMKSPHGEPPLGFTFAGIYLMCFIAFSTVYMGAQTEPLLFLLLGWGEGAKSRKSGPMSSRDTPTPEAAHGFRRILA